MACEDHCLLGGELSSSVLYLGSVETIERHFEAIRSTLTETDNLNCSLEALWISAKVDFAQMGA